MTQRLSEKEYQGQILEAARTLGWAVYHTHDSRRSAPGFPDLVLMRPPRVLFVEVKREGGKLTSWQEYWRNGLQDCPGVEYHLWEPSDWASVVDVLLP